MVWGKGMTRMKVAPAMVGEDLGAVPVFLRAWVGPRSPSASQMSPAARSHCGSCAASLIKWEFPPQETVCVWVWKD